jgi:hypothetical protein
LALLRIPRPDVPACYEIPELSTAELVLAMSRVVGLDAKFGQRALELLAVHLAVQQKYVDDLELRRLRAASLPKPLGS